MVHDTNDTPGHLVWFLLGAVVGAASAILLAPRAGRETRELLAERSGDLAKRAQDLATHAQDRAGGLLDRSREVLEEQTHRLMGAFEAGRDAMKEEMTHSPDRPEL
jgi:gas vesicle protein